MKLISLNNTDTENIKFRNPENIFYIHCMLYFCHWGKLSFSAFIFSAKISQSYISQYYKWCIGSVCGDSNKRLYHNPHKSLVLTQMLWAEFKAPFEFFPSYITYIVINIITVRLS